MKIITLTVIIIIRVIMEIGNPIPYAHQRMRVGRAM